jgi:abequosyltransferase
MDNSYLLTIAIPTYNRALSLDETLQSITQQIDDRKDIEIVISDNASTDATYEIVQKYLTQFSQIKYYKNEINKGIDYNIYKAAALSTGEYVYFLSDDDIMLPNSLNKMLSLIQEHQDIGFFYINGIGFTYNESHEKIYFKSSVIDEAKDMIFNDKNNFISFLKLQITFVSAFLFHRKSWNINTEKEQYIGTDIYLSYDLLHLLSNTHKYMYVAEPMIGVHASYTTGNYRIFYAFAYQWRKLLLEKAVQLGFDQKQMRTLFNNTIPHLHGRIKSIKFGNTKASLDFQAFKLILRSTYDTSTFWFKLLPILMTPSFVLIFNNKVNKLRKKIKSFILSR